MMSEGSTFFGGGGMSDAKEPVGRTLIGSHKTYDLPTNNKTFTLIVGKVIVALYPTSRARAALHVET